MNESLGAASAASGDPERDGTSTPPWCPLRSEKVHAGPAFKQTFGLAPRCAFVDHGENRTEETLVAERGAYRAQDR